MTVAQRWTEDPDAVGTASLVMEAEYRYDAFGNRLAKEVDGDGAGPANPAVTNFALDGQNPAKAGTTGNSAWDVWADLDVNGSLTTRYFHGDVVDQVFARLDGDDAYWLLTDRLGSIRQVTDAAGVVKDNITYDGFGNITYELDAAYRGRYAWTSRELDVETSLQYNRARYYDATTGRWLSQDPLGFDAGDSNLYRYVRNQPTAGLDPSGLDDVRTEGERAYWVFQETGKKIQIGSYSYTPQSFRQPIGLVGPFHKVLLDKALGGELFDLSEIRKIAKATVPCDFLLGKADLSGASEQRLQREVVYAINRYYEKETQKAAAAKFQEKIEKEAKTTTVLQGDMGGHSVFDNRNLTRRMQESEVLYKYTGISIPLPQKTPLHEGLDAGMLVLHNMAGGFTGWPGLGPKGITVPSPQKAVNPKHMTFSLPNGRPLFDLPRPREFPLTSQRPAGATTRLRGNIIEVLNNRGEVIGTVPQISGGAPATNLAQQVAANAARGFQNLQCQEAATAIQQALQRAGHSGQLIEIRGSGQRGFIVCNSLLPNAPAISVNGRHVGVRVGDLVFDNLHPGGMRSDQWIKDFDAIGGVRVHSVTDF